MPWDFSKAGLNGNIEFKLADGRFSTLNSYSARLLELLSLQSVKRLARLDFKPAGLTKEGFPYDNLRGTLVLKNGLMRTRAYRLSAPVGTIVLGGEDNLIPDTIERQTVITYTQVFSRGQTEAGCALNLFLDSVTFL